MFRMSTRSLAIALLVIAVAGCRYEVPLVAGSEIPVDRQVLGTWVRLDSEKDERVQVIGFSNREYLINYHVDDDVLYLRAYPIEFDGQAYVQVEFIGTGDEMLDADERKFDVIRYEVSGKTMSVSWLNTDVISKDITTSRQLKESIRRHREKDALFKQYGTFEMQR